LHMQRPLTSQSHCSISQREQLVFCYGSKSTPNFGRFSVESKNLTFSIKNCHPEAGALVVVRTKILGCSIRKPKLEWSNFFDRTTTNKPGVKSTTFQFMYSYNASVVVPRLERFYIG
jgi:hypothetical protein